MKILSNVLREQTYINPARHCGEVVHKHSGGGLVSGPYLVCYENAHTPRAIDGPGCGQCQIFLVDLYTGSRFNIKETDRFTLVNTELRIMEAKS